MIDTNILSNQTLVFTLLLAIILVGQHSFTVSPKVC